MIATPALWIPGESRFGAWWRRAREWRAAIATYLRVGPSGHLLYGNTGHLVWDCGTAPALCSTCGAGQTPSTLLCSFPSLSYCSSWLLFSGGPGVTLTSNSTGTFTVTLTQDWPTA